MPDKCRTCFEEIYWLRHYDKKTDVTSPKFAPINVEPHPKGNLVLNVRGGQYRFADAKDFAEAKRDQKNLYIAHFATCPHLDRHRRKKANNTLYGGANGPS